MSLDLYHLITQGQFSKTQTIPIPGHGYSITVEEVIVSGGGSPGIGYIPLNMQPFIRPNQVNKFKRPQLKKLIKIKVKLDNRTYMKQVLIDDVNLSVKTNNIKLENEKIKLDLYNVTLDNDDTQSSIEININDVDI